MANDRWSAVEASLRSAAEDREADEQRTRQNRDLRKALEAADPRAGASYERLCEAAGIEARYSGSPYNGDYRPAPTDAESLRLRAEWIDRLRRLAATIDAQGLLERIERAPTDNPAAAIVADVLDGAESGKLQDALATHGAGIAVGWSAFAAALWTDNDRATLPATPSRNAPEPDPAMPYGARSGPASPTIDWIAKPGTLPIPWTEYANPAYWATKLGLGSDRRAFTTRCMNRAIVHEKLDSKSYRIDQRHLPHDAP